MPQRPVRRVIENRSIVTAAANTTVIEAARLMLERRIGALPVVDQGRVVGIFTERDALLRVLAGSRDPHTTRLAEVMTPDPQTIHPDQPFAHALHMMYEGGFRHVPVIENSRVVGVVSVRDALNPEVQQFTAELKEREQIAELLGQTGMCRGMSVE